VAGVARIADNLEQLYFASKRTNASVENLQATGFAAKQMGVDAATALGSVESLARFLRNSPGGEGLLKNLGINTRDARGAMRDTVDLMGDLGKKFADMPYYKAHAFAQALGIDEKTLMAMREGMGDFQQQYKDMLHAAGVDSQQAAKGSHEFMVELRLLGAAFGVLEQKAASSLTGGLTVGSAACARGSSQISTGSSRRLGAVLDLVGRVLGAVGALATAARRRSRWLVDWFRNLTPAGQSIYRESRRDPDRLAGNRPLFLATPRHRDRPRGGAGCAVGRLSDLERGRQKPDRLVRVGAWHRGGNRRTQNDCRDSARRAGLGRAGRKHHCGRARGDGRSDRGYRHEPRQDDPAAVHRRFRPRPRKSGNRSTPYARSCRGPDVAAPNKQAGRGGSGTIHYPAAAPGSRAETVASHAEPSSNDPRGIRNNNPGNINYGDWARQHGATGVEAGPGGRFATFGNAQAGLDALADLLALKGTWRAASTPWPPLSPSTRRARTTTTAYVASVAARLGVDPNAHLDPRNLQQMTGLIDSIVRVENGKNPYAPKCSSARRHGAWASRKRRTSLSTAPTIRKGLRKRPQARKIM
jgi:hypothetical protein